MKAIKAVLVFIIAYFSLTAVSALNRLVTMVAGDNVYIEYGMYGIIFILTVIYLIVPILDYMNRPSLLELEKLMEGNRHSARRIRRHLLNTMDGEDLQDLKALDKKDVEGIRKYVQTFMIMETDAFDKIIRTYAFKLTSTVLLSPNSFIDGLAILYGNSSMIYELSKRTRFRYTVRELYNMYFSVVSVASVSGLIEEFDDEIEEIIKGVVDEFSNAIGEETGRSVGDAIPFLNVAVRASTILFQAAGNYAFIIYNGKRYKYRVRNAVDFSKKTEEEIRKQARKEARKSRYRYVHDMIRRIGDSGATSIKDLMTLNRKSSAPSEQGGIFEDLEEGILIQKNKRFFGFFNRNKE